MKCVEFDKMPPEFEICNTLDGQCYIRFYCDVTEVEGDEHTIYRANCFEMLTRQSDNLASRVGKNLGVWLEKAKKQEADQKAKEQKENYGARLDNVEGVTDDIVLLMAEIIGGEE